MKKIVCIALALLGTLPVSGQHYVGFKGGYGAAMGRFYPLPDKSGMLWNKYTGGVMWKYYSEQQVVGGVSVELEYRARGYKIFDADINFGGPFKDGNGIISDTTTYRVNTRTVSSVTLPLIWQPHLYMMNRKVRVFLNAGVTLTYNLGTGDTYTVTDYKWNKTDKVQTVTSTATDYTMQTARDVRWNYGFCGGFGLGVLMGRWELFAEGRYYFGLSDILRNRSKYQFDRGGPLRSELDNLFVTMGVFFRLGKGDITERPLRRSRGAPPGDNDFRNIKLNM